MSASRIPHSRFWTGVACLLIVLTPALSGCLEAVDVEWPFGARDVPGVRTGCDGPSGHVNTVPEVRGAYAKSNPPGAEPTTFLTPPIRIGLLVPDGETTDVERGVSLAVSELRRVGADVRLATTPVDEDDHDAVRVAFNETMDRARTGVIISGLGDDATEALVETARENRMPLIGAVADADRITARYDTGGYFFRMPWSQAVEGRAAAELVWASGCRTVNVIATPDHESTAVATAFRQAFESKGGHVVRTVTLQPGASNVDAVIARAQTLQRGDPDEVPRPDAALVIADASDAASVLRTAYVEHMSAHTAFYFTSSSKGASFVDEAGRDRNDHRLAEGLRGTAPMAAETRATDAFERAFRGAYGSPATNASARGYDAVYVSALSAACARDDRPGTLRTHMPIVHDLDDGDTDVSGADPRAALNTAVATCAVNYVGAAGDYDWDRRGDPVTGRYAFWTVTPSGSLKTTTPRVEPPALS